MAHKQQSVEPIDERGIVAGIALLIVLVITLAVLGSILAHSL